MSLGRRAYNLLRGYINREWDRIKSWERQDALRELEATTYKPRRPKDVSATESEPERTVLYVAEGTTPIEAARHVLGVEEGASFREIHHKFAKLNRRTKPMNLERGTDERRQAADIQKKIHWAYRTLTADMSDAEKRFGSLEIE